MKVVVLHLDLGIGGAEKLIVNLACALKQKAFVPADLDSPCNSNSTSTSSTNNSTTSNSISTSGGVWCGGHEVRVVTTHHDPSRCFDETKPDGVLGGDIVVYGSWLPRHLYKGRYLTALFASVRMMYAALRIVLAHAMGGSDDKVDVVLIDGVSTPIPLFQFFGIPVLFYCHYPDKLLVQDAVELTSGSAFSGGLVRTLKRHYRKVLDYIEEITTGCADVILVNSGFTANKFRDAFRLLSADYTPQILYPTVRDDPPDVASIDAREAVPYLSGYDHVFVSLNRYERKKNILLAIQAFKLLIDRINSSNNTSTSNNNSTSPTSSKRSSTTTTAAAATARRMVLVIAGGYDERVTENVEYCAELQHYAASNGLGDSVVFRRSISQAESCKLISMATAVLYTPENEHFGIVPIEAMQLGVPVVAAASGGPLESVKDGRTGQLVTPTPEGFADAMQTLISNDDTSEDDGDTTTTNTSTTTPSRGTRSSTRKAATPTTNTSTTANTSTGALSRRDRMGREAAIHVRRTFTDAAMRVKLCAYLDEAAERSSTSDAISSNRQRVQKFMWRRVIPLLCAVLLHVIVLLLLGAFLAVRFGLIL